MTAFHDQHAERSKLSTRAALASVAVALLLLGLKAYAAYTTQSVAMLGSLADTGLDLIASLVTLAGVRIAALPADSDHRFGHGKAEALVALFQIVLIIVSAGWIAFRSGQRLIDGAETGAADLGIGVSLPGLGNVTDFDTNSHFLAFLSLTTASINRGSVPILYRRWPTIIVQTI